MYKRPDGLYEKKITLDGKRVYFRGKTEREVVKKIADYKGEAKKGPLFSDMAEQWETEHFKNISFYTADCYKRPLKDVKDEFGGSRINTITSTDIQRYIAEYAPGRAKQTIKLRLVVLRQIFDFAIMYGHVATNPTAVVKIPKNAPKGERAFPQDEYIEIIKKSVSEEFGLFPYLLLYTGLRRGEALALRFDDVDRKSKTITVNKNLYFVGSKSEIKPPKTASGVRVVPLLDVLAKKLPKGKGYIFSGDNLISPKEFRIKWDKYCKSAGLTCIDEDKKTHNTVTPHQLRHAYATILFEAGVGEKDAQELMGHSKYSTTSDIYTHIRKARKDKTASILNKHLKGTVKAQDSEETA